MERYDYNEAVKNDVLDYINSEIDFADFDSLDELREHLNDVLWTNDSVTGNGSGSYYCNSWKAEEALAHNWDILADAMDEFGCGSDILRKGAESCDVTIRCYLLPGAIDEALDEIGFDGLVKCEHCGEKFKKEEMYEDGICPHCGYRIDGSEDDEDE